MSVRALTITGIAALTAACSETGTINGPELEGPHRVSLSFSTRPDGQSSSGAPNFMVAASDTLVDGENTLILDRVQIVLREIELERTGVVSCDGVRDRDECEEFEVGPILIDLPLDGGTEQTLTIAVDTGAFDEIEFEIHKIDDDDPEDAAFRQEHPDFIGTSIRVAGSFNGAPFVFDADVNAEQEFALRPPLVIDEATTVTNVTVRIDLSQWFVDSAGGLLDPQTANKGGANENLVETNIKRSFEAFGDDDRDGVEDDD